MTEPLEVAGTDEDEQGSVQMTAVQAWPADRSSLGRLRLLSRSRPWRAVLHLENWMYQWMAQNGLLITRVALGVIFLWFGALKFLPLLTPIDELAERTLVIVSFHVFTGAQCLHFLAAWECVIGVGLLLGGRFLRPALALMFLQLPGTFLPLILLRGETWIHFPWFPSFEGLYIFKNLVLISAGVIVGSMMRGGRIIAHPDVADIAVRRALRAEARALREDELQLK